MSDVERIAHLETIVRALHQQVETLRAEVAALRAATAAPGAAAPAPPGAMPARPSIPHPPPPPPSFPAAPAPSVPTSRFQIPATFPSRDLESFFGRYATIALATLAVLTGVGAFLTWAIAHGLLGPAQRVALGALGAAIVGGIGWRLRRRGTVRFGDTLLALALALVHLDAWAAGPRLHVVGASVALAITAGASAALAALALGAREELLFSVGLGGALLAPFVATSGGGNAYLLAGYGWIVITGGCVALRARAWRFAIALTGVGCALYAATLVGLTDAATPWLEHHLAPLLALACACGAIVLGARAVRAPLALAFLWVALMVMLVLDWRSGEARGALAIALVGTLGAYAAAARGSPTPGWSLTAATLQPLGFLGAAVAAWPRPLESAAALVAALWTGLALAAAWRDEARRELHLVTAAVASGAAVIVALHAHAEWCILALAAHAALWTRIARRARALPLLVPVPLGLAIASAWCRLRLEARPAYHYTPFLAFASLAALVTVLAWVHAATQARAMEEEGVGAGTGTWRVLAIAASLAAFAWIRMELARAFTPDIATFLLIVYYAAAGVGAIFVGRRRGLPGVRAAGLALALYAGIKALAQAWDLSAIGLRVGSCLLVGLFIALVSYWYRAPDDAPTRAPARDTGD
ncbi:MAG TPA: DUF2339 domain-containing protein [Gemmatimonadaceae bacterium]